jgi:hypothetical protein
MSLSRAKADMKRFITAGGFEVAITLTPVGGEATDVTGLATKHHNSISTDGIPINSKNTHISLIESDLTDKGITVRDSAGEINLRNWLVSFPDSSEVSKNYIVKETMPDETLGVIVCILGDYGS